MPGLERRATAPRLLLEVGARLPPSASDTESALLLQRIERIETRLDISLPAGEAAMNTEVSAPARQYVRKTQGHWPQAEPPALPGWWLHPSAGGAAGSSPH